MSPTLELTGAIVAQLKAAAVSGGRIYDKVPEGPTFPYVTIGSSFEIQDDADCIPGVEIDFRLHVWSRAPGFPECLRVAEATRAALHRQELTLDENAFVLVEHIRTDKLRDPDGLTSHAVVEFRAIVEQPLQT